MSVVGRERERDMNGIFSSRRGHDFQRRTPYLPLLTTPPPPPPPPPNRLIDNGHKGLHYYTLNQDECVFKILDELGMLKTLPEDM